MGYQEDVGLRHDLARQHLTGAGISLDPPSHRGGPAPRWSAETGHTLGVSYRPETGYVLSATHHGDPSGNVMHALLGTHDPAEVPARVAREFRHPEFTGHMRDMYLRATGNNDPTGEHPELQRYSRDEAPDPRSIRVDHYRNE